MKNKADTKDKPAIYYEKESRYPMLTSNKREFKINTLMEILKILIP